MSYSAYTVLISSVYYTSAVLFYAKRLDTAVEIKSGAVYINHVFYYYQLI